MSQLAGLLQLLREEFTRMATDVDEALLCWLGDASQASTHANAAVATWERLAAAMRVIGLEGQAQVLELLADTAQLLALSDETSMGTGLGWLLSWEPLLEACLAQPGQAEPVAALLDYLRASPAAPDEAQLAELALVLGQAPALAPDDEEQDPEQVFAHATPEDLSLALPEDLDAGLFDAFLHDAPEQAAQLSQAVRALLRGGLPTEQLHEVQRVAHTFKGSGNILGLSALAKLAHRMEDVLEFSIRQQNQAAALPERLAQDLAQAADTLEHMVAALRGEDAPPTQAHQHLNRLTDWVRAIHEGRWQEFNAELTAEATEATTPTHQLAADGGRAARAGAADAPAAATNHLSAHAKVPMARLDQLLRQAGQALVQHSQLGGQLQQFEQHLGHLHASQSRLSQHLQALTVQLQRQQVSLHVQAQQPSAQDFDPLELDRYTELHTLAQLLAEQLHDAHQLAQAMQAQTQQSQQQLREHGVLLKQQHEVLLAARLVPFRQILARLRRNVSQTAAATGKQAQLRVQGEDLLIDSDVLEQLAEPLLHLLRNAVDHGIEPPERRQQLGKPLEGTIHLQLSRDGQTLRLSCSDDGQGLDAQAIRHKALSLGLIGPEEVLEETALYRLILLPGFSTRQTLSQISGRGVGMDVVAQRIHTMKGRLDIHSQPGQGSRFSLSVPASAGSQHALLVKVAGQLLALPTRAVQHALSAEQVRRDGASVYWREQSWRHAYLSDWLGLLNAPAPAPQTKPVVVVQGLDNVVALEVDEVQEARELITQDLGRLLRCVPGLLGGALTREGRVLLLLDPALLEQHAQNASPEAQFLALARQLSLPEPVQAPRVLVVEDSLSVRQSLSQLLGDAGWEVHEARDGLEALALLGGPQPIDVVLTDLEMPRLNGLELTRQLREQARWRALPVLMLTSRNSDKHRQSALALGVNTYLCKPCPDAQLLAALQALLVPRA